MIRVFVVHFALFLLPFIAYAAYLLFVRRVQLSASGVWTPERITWLAVAGLFVTALSFVILSVFIGADAGSTYVPARIEDGRIVPGYFE